MTLTGYLDNYWPRLTTAQKEHIQTAFNNARELNLQAIETMFGKKIANRFNKKSDSNITIKTVKKYFPLFKSLRIGYVMTLAELPKGKLTLSRDCKTLTLSLYTWQ